MNLHEFLNSKDITRQRCLQVALIISIYIVIITNYPNFEYYHFNYHIELDLK
jgi:hypothetical protein